MLAQGKVLEDNLNCNIKIIKYIPQSFNLNEKTRAQNYKKFDNF
ncbi:MAG: hypothetical protein K0R25_544 [Rickettsiaceae bacterium]|nr:hypothetical protein [Rickettsiaceae bacterium]